MAIVYRNVYTCLRVLRLARYGRMTREGGQKAVRDYGCDHLVEPFMRAYSSLQIVVMVVKLKVHDFSDL